MATGVKYIGKSEDHTDRIYGTGLKFVPGKVYSIEDSVAKKMLAHTDAYAPGKIPPGTKMVRAITESDQENARRNDPPMLDFTRMPDSELRDFARMHYNEQLPSHAKHQTLVDRLVSFSHRAR